MKQIIIDVLKGFGSFFMGLLGVFNPSYKNETETSEDGKTTEYSYKDSETNIYT